MPFGAVERGRSAIDYILDRTFCRPREAISFLNKCIQRGEGKTRLTAQNIRDAEGGYSSERLNSLFDEWRREYPFLKILAGVLQGCLAEFELRQISRQRIEDVCALIYDSPKDTNHPKRDLFEDAATNVESCWMKFCAYAFTIFYQTGLVGIKLSSTEPCSWSFENRPTISEAQLTSHTSVYIHKTFHLALGVPYLN
jgi:hypothetical protein